MKHSIVYIFILSMFLSISCKSDKKETDKQETNTETTETNTKVEDKASPNTEVERPSYFDEKKKITVSLEAKSDSGVKGNVVFSQDKGVVTMVAIMGGLTEGEHAIHLHEKADCSADDGTSTGGHWNPTGQPHGKWGDEGGYHKGDIGNFSANDKGNATITHVTNEWCIGCGDDTKDILGKAVIVHQGVDDYTSQPSGAAGSRISCGGIIE